MIEQAKIGVINLETGEVAHLTTKDGVTIEKRCHCQGKFGAFTGTFQAKSSDVPPVFITVTVENGFIIKIE